MRHTSTAVHDVFLSHVATDASLAEAVGRVLAEAGLSVFLPADADKVGEKVQEAILREVGASLSFVVLLTPTAAHNPNLALEVGAAWGLAIPTYVLTSGVSPGEVPVYLAKYRQRPLWDGVPAVVEDIRAQTRPITDEQRRALVDGFLQIGLPVDRLISDPAAVSELSAQFRAATGTAVKSDRLLRELLRMRKAKKLPKLTARTAG